jgi:hypothetical protein
MVDIEVIARDVVDCAIKVHKALGLACWSQLISSAMLLS